MIDSKDRFNSFVRAIYKYLQQNGLSPEIRLSEVRELIAHAIAGQPSNRLAPRLGHTPVPFSSALCEQIASSIETTFGLSISPMAWRWPLPASFNLEPFERTALWQEAFESVFSLDEVDGVWRDAYFDAEPYVKPLGDGHWGICNRSPVPFWLCRDIFGAQWVTRRNADNTISDQAKGRLAHEAIFHSGLAALWKKDYPSAFSHFLNAERSGHAMATFNLAWMLDEALGGDRDVAHAARLYQVAIDRGVVTAHHNLAHLYLQGDAHIPKSIPDAIRHFELAAASGISASMGCLGMIYLDGNGVPADRSKGIDWLLQAAKLGDEHSVNTLAAIIDRDRGGASTAETFAMYRIAARAARELSDATPIYNLGLCFFGGNGVEQDLVKARRLFRIAATAGDPDAAFNLGLMYLNGKGTSADPYEAKKIFGVAAAEGHAEALNCLGVIEFNGLCAERDYGQAWKLFAEAAQADCVNALVNQARCIVMGWDVEGGMEHAFELLEHAAELGHPLAMEMRIQWETQV